MSMEIRIVRLPEKKFVGLPVTSSFARHEPERIEEVRTRFLERCGDIRPVVDPEKYACVSFTSDVLFTYIHCMEVGEFEDIPQDMIGFATPAREYIAIRSKDDPYEAAHAHMRENGMSSEGRALFWEEYDFENPQWPENVWVYIPLKENANLD